MHILFIGYGKTSTRVAKQLFQQGHQITTISQSPKTDVYANRINAANPTRLFVDALNTSSWRKKGFSSMVDKLEESNASIMMQYLFQKEVNPLNLGAYSPETDELTCVKNKDELEEFFDDNPHKGMPYGFPALQKDEYNLLMT